MVKSSEKKFRQFFGQIAVFVVVVIVAYINNSTPDRQDIRQRAATMPTPSQDLVVTRQSFIQNQRSFSQNAIISTRGAKEDYERVHLPNSLTSGNYIIRSGLPKSQLPAFLTLLNNETNAFFKLMGSNFTTPLPTDKNTTMKLFVFATSQEYREYMTKFQGGAGVGGGIYLQSIGTLFTYQRTPLESVYTVEELIQHEFAHYLSHRYIYPGSFTSPGYFDQPKGWSDEGTSEFFAGMVFDASGNYATPLRQNSLRAICGKSFRSLSSLLSQTAGYNDPGTFDYENAWAFSYYLNVNRHDVAIRLYRAFKNNTYKVANFASIAGVPSVAALETDWHNAMRSWCNPASAPTNAPIPSPACLGSCPTTPTPSQPIGTPLPSPTSTLPTTIPPTDSESNPTSPISPPEIAVTNPPLPNESSLGNGQKIGLLKMLLQLFSLLFTILFGLLR